MKGNGLLFRVMALTVIGLVTVVTMVFPVLAAEPEPDSVSLEGIVVFQDLITDGDWLAVVPYNIPVTGATYPINQTFIFRLLSPDASTENGTTLAYPAYNDGYGSGMVSFYFESGMEDGGAYIFRVQENPTYYPAALYWDFVIGDSNYSSATDQAAALKAKIVDSATFLTTSFEVALLAKSEAGTTVLSTYGELYYLTAIPGLQTMCPELFSVQLEDPDYTKRSWAYTLADALKTKYEDTFIEDFMTGYAGLFSMETTAAMNFLSIMFFVALIGLSIWKFKATALSALIDGYALLLLLMLCGMFDMVFAGAMAFSSSGMGGVVLFLNRA